MATVIAQEFPPLAVGVIFGRNIQEVQSIKLSAFDLRSKKRNSPGMADSFSTVPSAAKDGMLWRRSLLKDGMKNSDRVEEDVGDGASGHGAGSEKEF
ncbi:MAG TPA: hypothetical protein VIE89_14485 [Candidatus Binatia bacterium]|jgi:hypothetical protein